MARFELGHHHDGDDEEDGTNIPAWVLALVGQGGCTIDNSPTEEEPAAAGSTTLGVHSWESNRDKSAGQLAMEAEAEMAEEDKCFASYRRAWESRCGSSRGCGFFEDASE